MIHAPDVEGLSDEDAEKELKLTRRSQRVRNFIAAMTVVVVIMLAVLAPIIIRSSDNTDAIRDGSELTACRAQFAAELVTPAQDAATKAANQLVLQVVDTNSRIVDGLAASVLGDDERLRALAEQADAAAGQRAAVIAEFNAAQGRLAEARTEYNRAAIQGSIDDPEGFLAECRERNR